MMRTAALLAAALAVATVSPAMQDSVAMRSILDALLEVTPLALDETRFGDPANAVAIDNALERLANNALMIDAHTSGLGPSYDLLRRTMADETRRAVEAWKEGDLRRTRFLVRNLGHDCFACHSRLPAPPGGDTTANAAAAVSIDLLPARQRMQWLVATRQFEAAMTHAETVLGDDSVPAAEIDRTGLFEDYLRVALRVDRDPHRPLSALEAFAGRADLPVYLQMQSAAWIDSLRSLISEPPAESLDAARALLGEARRLNLYQQDRRGLVQAVAASGLLHAYVLDPSPAADRRAEAYYLLGLAESSISYDPWVPETEYFLELAIRSAPGTETARAAYAFFEQYVIAGYTGSGGTELSEDVAARLERLRRLAED